LTTKGWLSEIRVVVILIIFQASTDRLKCIVEAALTLSPLISNIGLSWHFLGHRK